MFFFFFSSRRRHTRWNCDWSSDVCSSDLCDHITRGQAILPRYWPVWRHTHRHRRGQTHSIKKELEDLILQLFFLDRKSTRLNSSHSSISYAVFCLKKKKKKYNFVYVVFII